MTETEISALLKEIGNKARHAAQILAQADTALKRTALQQISAEILRHKNQILHANAEDIANAKTAKLSAAFIDRLRLTEDRIQAMANAVQAISELDDPVGRTLAQWKRPNGLQIQRVAVPLGVIAVIFESRPNVTADAASLCLLSGNAAILRGGSESFYSAQAIMHAITAGLAKTELPVDCVQMIPTQDRHAVGVLLTMDDTIDVIVPRGGKSLIERITQESRIPLFKHLDGLCHTYIHQSADHGMAIDVVLNAKMRRPGICGATETVLIDRDIAASLLPELCSQLMNADCEIRGDQAVAEIVPDIIMANESDWATEYLDAIVSIKVVNDITAAIDHIRQFGSQHTEAIIAQDKRAAKRFFNEVDSAIVMHNTSTQFADGGEFGMGAEIGISTGKLHARGPVGVEQLTTFKYIVKGSGQIRP